MSAIFRRRYLERFLIWLTPPGKKPPGLVETVDDAKRTWQQALDYLNHIDKPLVDYAVHNINASERRYMALIAEARREGVTAWPASVHNALPPLDETRDGHDGPSAGPGKNSSGHEEAVNL